MNLDEILALGQRAAKHLGIRIQYPQFVLDKMKPSVSVTTILHNEEWMLWIDRHYIAFSKLTSPEVVYVMADINHVKEELRGIKDLIQAEQSPTHVQTLLSVKKQLELARSAMKQSGEQSYIFDIVTTIPPYKANITPATSKLFVLTLCGKCRSYFENTGEYKLHCADHSQYNKEQCGYCTQGRGFDYEITPKRRKERI